MMSNVLIVDDSTTNRKLIRGIFLKKISDVNIIEAEDGYKALSIIDNEDISVIILDIMMPGMDGLEVLYKIKANEGTKNIPVIMCSAVTEIENIEKALVLGALDYFTKPLSEIQMKITLPLKVKNALEYYKNRKELLQKQNMLRAIAQATNELLGNSDVFNAISNSLMIIGKATDVSRAYLFKNNYDDKSLSSISCKSEWASNFTEPQTDNPNLQNISPEKFSEFIKPLSQRLPFVGIVRNLQPSKTKKLLEEQGILSILVLPVFCENEFWGFVGFDECKHDKVWDDDIVLLMSFVNSISASISRNNSESRIEYLSYHNELTGLYNRRKFEIELEKIDQEGIFPVSIIMGDVNGLKLVNDAFGHTNGDYILKRIAEIIKYECGGEACVARYGGDEFAIILPNVAYNEANLIVNNIHKRCLEETTNELMLNISFGIGTKACENDDLQKCGHLAEERMYASKLLESKSTRNTIIANLRTVMEEKTGETKMHGERMAKMSQKIGEELGMQSFEIEYLRLLSLLHDIGKTGVPDSILLKPDKLNDEEWKVMRKHCEIGFRISSTLPELMPIADSILSHHERWDGSGYPQSLKGEDIPLMARIIAVLDSFDAMTNIRPYRKVISEKEAMEELIRCSGTQFDPKIVKFFISTVLKNNIKEC